MASQSAQSSFKSQIRWSSLPDPSLPEGWVLLKSIQPFSLPILNEEGWEIFNHFVIPLQPGLVQESWSFKQQDNAITLEIVVSSLGYALAQQYLLDVASATMMVQIPYRLSEIPLGDKAIVAPDSPVSRQVIWVYKNVCAKVDINSTEIPEIFPLASGLQRYFEENIVPELQDHLPKVNLNSRVPKRLELGKTLTIKIRKDEDIPAKDLLIYPTTKGNNLEIIDQNPVKVTVQAKNIGWDEISIGVIDQGTLLSNSQKFEIEVISSK